MATSTESSEFVISRVLDAPRHLVWKCFTEPEHMKPGSGEIRTRHERFPENEKTRHCSDRARLRGAATMTAATLQNIKPASM